MSGPDEQPVLAVLCAEAVGRPPHMALLEQRMSVRYTDVEGLADAVKGADALLLWDFFSEAVKDVWHQRDRLGWIHVAAAGVDKLLFDELAESDVVVTNARGVFDRPIAEFVLASILAHAKDLHLSHDLQLAREWRHRETRSVIGKTVMIVGTGAIGRQIARLVTSLGMEVRGAGRVARTDDTDFTTVVASADLASQAGWADYLVVAAPLTDQTRGLVDENVFAAMKPTGFLINIGRGQCVVTQHLVAAVTAGQIEGAALDVFEKEPLPLDDPLWDTPGVVISAHMSGDTVGWREALAEQFVDNALRWLGGRPLLNVVDKRLGFVPAPAPTKEGA